MNVIASIPEWLTKPAAIPEPRLPAWLIESRKLHWNAFLQNGLPTRKDERWKYTDLSFLANQHFTTAKRIDEARFRNAVNQHRLQHGESILLVFVNGYFMPELSDMAKLPANVIACQIGDALAQHSALIESNWPTVSDATLYPFASLNAAMCTDGLFFFVPENCEMTQPIHFLSLVSEDAEFIAHPHHMIVLGKNSKLSWVEDYFAFTQHAYMMNIVTTFAVGQNAKLEYCKIQQEGEQAVHMANTFILQKQNSSVTTTYFSTGSAFARDDIIVKLQEPGADCKTGGFYHLNRDNQYIDFHVDIEHAAPRSNSEMLYKGILNKKSRAVFNGRLSVKKDAQKILAYQANHNLLLSSEAEVYSKPELEIYADDVKCKHGATTGQIDQDALFYMRSRGITLEEAMHILLQGFAEEIVQRVSHKGVKMRVQEMVQSL